MKKIETKIQSKALFKTVFSGLFLCFIFILFGCQSNSSEKTELEKLENVTLNMKDLSGNLATLVNGKYEEPHLHVQVLDAISGDFNHDGLFDGVLLIVENQGGTGSFYKLCLFFNNGIKLVQTDQFFLGDRIKIKSLDLNGNEVTVRFLGRNKNEPFSKKPHVKKTIQLKITNAKFDEPPVG